MGPVIHVYKAGSLVWAYEIRWGTAVSEPISTLLGIGPFRITGAMPAAQDLANGFLDRSDELEARR